MSSEHAASAEAQTGQGRYLRSGALAGAASAFGFALVHAIVISDIWNTLVIMMVAGAVCGLCICWSYRRLFSQVSVGSWLLYNLVYLAMFGLLGAVSVAVFDPVTTVTAIMEAGGPVDDLIVQALPTTVVFTFSTAGLVGLLFGRASSDFGAVLSTTAVLVIFLGLNISVIGLVEFDGGSAYLVLELLGLVLAIGAFYASAFVALEWKRLTTH